MFSSQPGLLRLRHLETRPVSNLSECLLRTITQTEKDYILWLVVTKEMHEYFYAGAKGIVL